MLEEDNVNSFIAKGALFSVMSNCIKNVRDHYDLAKIKEIKVGLGPVREMAVF
jgi:hypothetical protein